MSIFAEFGTECGKQAEGSCCSHENEGCDGKRCKRGEEHSRDNEEAGLNIALFAVLSRVQT